MLTKSALLIAFLLCQISLKQGHVIESSTSSSEAEAEEVKESSISEESAEEVKENSSEEAEDGAESGSDEDYAKIQAECAKELGIPEEMIKKLDEDDDLYSEENNRCYLKCLFENSAVIDNEGKYNAKAFEEAFPDVKDVAKHLPECEKESEEEDNMCDKVYTVFKCIYGDE